MESQIIYKRVMKATYNVEGDGLIGGYFASELQNAGLSLTDAWISERTEYGFKVIEKNTKVFDIVNSRNKVVYSDKYLGRRNEVYEQIKNAWKVSRSTRVLVTENEKWVEPVGERLILDEPPSGVTTTYGTYGRNYSFDGSTSTMKVNLSKPAWGNEIKLTFTIKWAVPKVQDTRTIEHNVVDVPMETMAIIQSKVEDVFKVVGFTVEGEPEIDCTFEAITNSKTECSPETIGKLREMKNSKKATSEEE
jgi:hypothetical protein